MDQAKLRPIIAFPVNVGGRVAICLRDATDLAITPLGVPHELRFMVAQCDGKHSILDIQAATIRPSVQWFFSDVITVLIAKLDESLLLDNARLIKASVHVLASHYSTDPLSDGFTQRLEYPIEFQALFPRDLLGPAKRFCTVPILVGSFDGCVERQISSAELVQMAGDHRAGQQTVTDRAEPICYVVATDMPQVGMKFEAQGFLTPAVLERVAWDDHALRAATTRTYAEGYFRPTAEHHDRRRICGFPPIYRLLSTMPASAGKVLKHDQAVEPAGQSMASYASVVFY